jgi:hypothetical protein
MHVGIKSLTGYATRLNREHKLRELEVLQQMSSVPTDHCARLLTHFFHQGIDNDGEHLCLVTELFSSTIQDAKASLQGEFFPVQTVKRILRHVCLVSHTCTSAELPIRVCFHLRSAVIFIRRSKAGQYDDRFRKQLDICGY